MDVNLWKCIKLETQIMKYLFHVIIIICLFVIGAVISPIDPVTQFTYGFILMFVYIFLYLIYKKARR